ncbi:MAG TPA: NTP transferase domain-containing protein [Actinophytocola sp.]|uniref:nucleotidyltransferase family protein n=1 Tax=Actinophytocola sp. TaxID=1872138 RepID=UPI002DB888D8|nr:NTP transferase domain-containing protein [Actinophytocola sp.]HEU5470378.1 NTP transferase domain-containing protein [Actinophytocola sp.]
MSAPDAVAGLLLAAGGGRRYGLPKALVPYRGRLFVEHAAGVLHAAGLGPVVVVLGAAAAEVRTRAHLPGSSLVDNPDWPTGMGSSLRAGLAALSTSDAVAVVILPVDTPGVTAAAVARLAALASPDALARATYHGAPGHPVLIGRAHWPAVHAEATADAGARSYLAGHPTRAVPCADIASGLDVDRPTDLPS